MTPAEHLAEAERLINEAASGSPQYFMDGQEPGLLAAQVHALIAIAAELGVPHGETAAGGGPGAAQAQAG